MRNSHPHSRGGLAVKVIRPRMSLIWLWSDVMKRLEQGEKFIESVFENCPNSVAADVRRRISGGNRTHFHLLTSAATIFETRSKRKGREGSSKGRKEKSASAFLCANFRVLCAKKNLR